MVVPMTSLAAVSNRGNRPRRVWLVTSRLGTGKSQIFFYRAELYAGQHRWAPWPLPLHDLPCSNISSIVTIHRTSLSSRQGIKIFSITKNCQKEYIILRLTRHHDGLLLPLPQPHHRVRQEGQELLFKWLSNKTEPELGIANGSYTNQKQTLRTFFEEVLYLYESRILDCYIAVVFPFFHHHFHTQVCLLGKILAANYLLIK